MRSTLLHKKTTKNGTTLSITLEAVAVKVTQVAILIRLIDLGHNRNTDKNAKSKKMAKHWPSKIRRRIGCRKKGIFTKNSGNEFITVFSFMLVQSHAIL